MNFYIPNTYAAGVSFGYIMIGITIYLAFYKYDNKNLNILNSTQVLF